MPKENNKMQVDIDTLKKQNVNDLLSIKELYSKLEELGEKITQIKYIDNTIVKKIKKEYGKLEKIILDENIQVKLNNNIETINSQMGNKANKNETFVKVENFKRLDGESGDSARIKRAIEYGINNNIRNILFDSLTYEIETSITVPSNINLVGQNGMGWGTNNVQTIFKKINDVPILKLIGDSVLVNNGVRNEGVNIKNIIFNGANLETDIIYIEGATLFSISNCFIRTTKGNGIYACELMDSRINNCMFSYCGNDNNKSAIFLESDKDGFEYTNNIYINQCNFEQNVGHSIFTYGRNTNKIYVTNTKIESGYCNNTSVVLQYCSGCRFNNVFISQHGTKGNVIDSIIKINNCQMMDISLDLHYLNPSNQSETFPHAELLYFADVSNSSGCNIYLQISAGTGEYYTSPTIVKTTNNGVYMNIDGYVNPQYKYVAMTSTQLHRLDGKLQITGKNGFAPEITFRNDDINDYWVLGRVIKYGSGTSWKFLYNKNGAESEIFRILDTGSMQISKPLILKDYLRVNSISDITSVSKNVGNIVFDSSDNKFKGYNGKEWIELG